MANLQFDDVRIEDFDFDVIGSAADSRGLVPVINLSFSVQDKEAGGKFLKYLNSVRDQQLSNSDTHMAIGFQTYIPGARIESRVPRNSGRYPWGEDEKRIPKVARIFYDDVATVVFWTDGTKTVVKCQEGTPYDEYTAFCAAFTKKLYGNNSKLQREIKKKARYSKKRQVAKAVCGEHSVREGNTIYPYKADRIIGKVTSVKETDNGLEVEVTKND